MLKISREVVTQTGFSPGAADVVFALNAPFSIITRHSKPCYGKRQPPKDLLSLHPPCVIAALHRNEFIEEKYTSTELKRSHSPLVLSTVFTLHNHFICQAPFSSRNYCWSPEVRWVYWQYVPGNLYLPVGKALFRTLSNARRGMNLTASPKTLQTIPFAKHAAGRGPCLPGPCWGCRPRRGHCWGHGCHSSREAKMVSQNFCSGFCFCLRSSKKKFTQANIYRN